MMAIRLIVPMETSPQSRGELIKTFQTVSPEVRQEPGCQEYELYQSVERPEQFVLLGACLGNC